MTCKKANRDERINIIKTWKNQNKPLMSKLPRKTAKVVRKKSKSKKKNQKMTKNQKFPISKSHPKTSKPAFKTTLVCIIPIDIEAKMDFKSEVFQELISAKFARKSTMKTQSYLSGEISAEVPNISTSQELFQN